MLDAVATAVRLSILERLDSRGAPCIKLQGAGGNRFPSRLDAKRCRKHAEFCGQCADEANHGRPGSGRGEIRGAPIQDARSAQITAWRKAKAAIKVKR